MEKPIQFLHLEDDPRDAELAQAALESAGICCETTVAQTSKEFDESLSRGEYDIILADYSLPGYDGMSALRLVREHYPEIPFIFVSGTMGEDAAIHALTEGATDYVLKHKLSRLVPAVRRALQEAEIRMERQRAQEALLASEKRFRALVENGSEQVSILSADAMLMYENPSANPLLGYEYGEFQGTNLLRLVYPDDSEFVQSELAKLLADPPHHRRAEFRLRHRDGTWRWVEAVGTNLLAEPAVQGIVINYHDISERRQADEQIRYQARLLRHVNDAIIAIDDQFRITTWNRAAEAMYGWNSKEVMGHKIAEILRTGLTGEQQAETVEHLKESTASRGETVHHRKDGRSIYVETSTIALTNEQRQITGFVSVNRDITERKRAEERLRQSEEQYRSLFEDSPLSLWVEDFSEVKQRLDQLKENGIDDIPAYLRKHLDFVNECANQVKILDVNSASMKLYHAKHKSELVGRLSQTFQRLHPEQFEDELIQIANGRLNFEREGIDSTLTGEKIQVNIRWSVAPGYEESLARVIVAAMDVTKRKQAEEALRKSEEIHRLVVRNINEIIYRVGIEDNLFSGAMQFVSPSIESILGYQPHDFLEEPGLWLRIIHPDDLPSVIASTQRLRENKEETVREYRLQHKTTGEFRWIEDHVVPLFDDQGSLTGIQGVARDITAQKKAEEVLHQSVRQEVQARRMHVVRELLIILTLGIGVFVAAFELNAFETLSSFVLKYKGTALDELITSSIFLALAFMAFSYRRWREVKAEIIERRIVEDALRVMHGELDLRVQKRTAELVKANESLQAEIAVRKQAEESLREEEQLLSSAQRIGHIGSWNYETVANTIQCSDEMYRLLDTSPEEFQYNGAAFLGLIYASDQPMIAKWIEDIRVHGKTKEIEFRILRKNSELRYIHCTGAVEFDEAGKPGRYIGTAQDVTERKLAEIQIRQQIERLTALRKVDQAISSSFDLNVTLDILLSQMISQLQVDAADILLLEPDGRMLTYATGKGFRTPAVESEQLRLADSQAARERRSIHVHSLENKPDIRLLTPLGATEDFVCYFGVPLIVKGKVKGVLEIFHRAPLHPYAEWLDFLHTLAGQAAIAIENATLFENLEQSNRELSQAYDATIEGWSRALDLRDKETEGHTQRVTALTLDLARAFSLPEEELLYVRWGALLHDIGKMGVPDHILLKPGELTEEEWIRMKSHPQYAYDLLKPITFLGSALDIPYCHHEKWDGSGYPRELKGQEIPLVARLFAVVDVWDALRSDRPYRKAWTTERVREYIRAQAGSHFDPKVVDYFLELIKE